MTIKMTMVERQPPPSFLAPQPAMIVLKKLFMMYVFIVKQVKRGKV